MKKVLFISALSVFSLHCLAMTSLAGDSEKEQLKAALSSHSNDMRACYRDHQKSIKGAQGKIYFDFEVNDQGALVKSDFDRKKTTLKNEALFKCVVEKVKTWFLPRAPQGKTVKVLFPFTFQKIGR